MTLAPIRPEQNATHDDKPAASAPVELALTVVRGAPTPEELAALTAVVVALSEGTPEPEAGTPQRTWARRNQLRLAPRPGPVSWRRSGR